MRSSILILVTCLGCLLISPVCLAQTNLEYVPAPTDNPLKGLVPYAGDNNAKRFPHSMEFSYVALNKLVVGKGKYDWRPLEKLLNEVSGRRRQAVIRVWMEYPKKSGIPAYLEKEGVKITEWLNTNTAPFPPEKCRTPDYEDPRTRKMLSDFIVAFGKRYDGDPRIGYITAGLVGTWGEWHTYPRDDLMASKTVQAEVMDAYERAFNNTRVLLRYPAGKDAYSIAANDHRAFGYHDDSFAWATLDTGKLDDDWFYIPALNVAGPKAINKWKTQPIGGEIRPELWGQIFDEDPKHKKAQDFAECVRQTHVTWLMDTGMFEKKQSNQRIANAKNHVQSMGYEFHVSQVTAKRMNQSLSIQLEVENWGVAPFYYPWAVELGVFDKDKLLSTIETDWKVVDIHPDKPATWAMTIEGAKFPEHATALAVRVVNPLPNGLPLVFANSKSRRLKNGWLRISDLQP